MVTFRGSNLEINERMKLMTEELIRIFRASQVGHENRQVLQADITCQEPVPFRLVMRIKIQ